MKYCMNCGSPVNEQAVVCVHCGCNLGGYAPNQQNFNQQNMYQQNMYQPVPVQKDDTMSVVIKIFMILGCISQGFLIIPLAWCIPMTVSVFHSLRDRRPISTGMKICSMLFVNLIAGICMLCVDDL